MKEKNKKLVWLFAALCLTTAVLMRFFHITKDMFFFYDEGMWLNAGQGLVNAIHQSPPQNLGEFFKILSVSLSMLGTAKSLWLFISNLRAFFIDGQGFYFARIVSAVFGVLTLGVVYLFVRRYFQSWKVALLSVLMLSLFPSHVFYSRLALQESLSTFFFLLGMYCYVFSKGLRAKTFLSAICFSLVYFSNYRMIIIPIIVGFCELLSVFMEKKKFDVRKYIWSTVTFFAVIFLLGSLYHGKNIYITFAWMFHQSDLAMGNFEWLNLLSYPYYLFSLESFWFGLLFFGSIYFFIKKQFDKLLPFSMSLFLMVLFSFPQEKGVRYLCVVMPFMVMAAAYLSVELYQKGKVFKKILASIVVLMFLNFLIASKDIIQFKSDYQTSVEDILSRSPQAKVFSTQDMVQKLFMPRGQDVREAPKYFERVFEGYQQGFQYVIIDPQAYISWTEDGKRFSQPLEGYLGFFMKVLPPAKVYPHFSKMMLKRFVLEHNESLARSLRFLSLNSDGQLGVLRIYDLSVCLPLMSRMIQGQGAKKLP